MSRRKFIQRAVAVAAATATGLPLTAQQKSKSNEYYELRVYELRGGRGVLDDYFSKALIPALNRAGVKAVGVFTEWGKSEPPKLYLLIPYTSAEAFGKINDVLKSDAAYQSASEAYNAVAVENAIYWRYTSSLMRAFDGYQQMTVPKNTPRIFEIRTYEGYSEDAVRRKVSMFNSGEIDIFNRTKLNIVFFGDVKIGDNLPCLTYMLTFSNMAERDANWQAFVADPEWQRISKLPEYANTVSRIHKTFLEPVSYSQI